MLEYQVQSVGLMQTVNTALLLPPDRYPHTMPCGFAVLIQKWNQFHHPLNLIAHVGQKTKKQQCSGSDRGPVPQVSGT